MRQLFARKSVGHPRKSFDQPRRAKSELATRPVSAFFLREGARCAATRRSCTVLIAILLGGVAPASAQSPPPLRQAVFTQPVSNLDQLLVLQSWWHVGDMVSTAYDLQHGGREANPILAPFERNPVALSIVSGAFDVLQVYFLKKLAPRHPKLAHIWAGGLLVTEIWVTTNNVRAAGELQRRRRSY